MPVTMPNSLTASRSSNPERMSIAGNKMATAELMREPLARTEVIGRDALSNGFSSFFGLERRPPCKKKQRVDAVKEKR